MTTTTILTVRIPTPLFNALTTAAHEMNTTRSRIVRDTLTERLIDTLTTSPPTPINHQTPPLPGLETEPGHPQ